MERKEYSNGEITIVWNPKVYNPNERPWIKPDNATSTELIMQVAKCPSGALSIKAK